MKAIITNYKDIPFRSKLEATTAKFFDAYNMKWEYEPQTIGFSDGTKYLPDFYFDVWTDS